MAGVTLESLRAQVREAVDMVGSSFVSDASSSLDAVINRYSKELYGILTQKFKSHFETAEASLSLVADTAAYTVHASMLLLRGVDVLDGSDWIPLKQGTFADRRRLQRASSLTRLKYRQDGQKVVFMPAPNTSGTAKAYYTPMFTIYSDPAHSREWYEWESYIVFRAAAVVANKEESDTSFLTQEANRIQAELERQSSTRHSDEPASVADYRSDYEDELLDTEVY